MIPHFAPTQFTILIGICPFKSILDHVVLLYSADQIGRRAALLHAQDQECCEFSQVDDIIVILIALVKHDAYFLMLAKHFFLR